MSPHKRMSPSLWPRVKAATAILLAISLILSMTAPATSFAQGVPPVGPSGCVWGCGGGTVSPGMGGGMNMGGLFGGLAVGIGLSILGELLSETSTQQKQQLQKRKLEQIRRAQQRREAMQRAIAEQRRIQQERHDQLVSSLMDAADAQLMDDPSKISIMENLPTRQLISIHRINSRPGDLEAFWKKNNDVWFSTRGYTAQAVSAQPMPLSDQAVSYHQSQLKSLRCVGPTPYGGKICPFPNMRVSVTRVETIDLPPPNSPSGFSKLISQMSEYKGKFAASFRGSWNNISGANPNVPDLITFTSVDQASKLIPGWRGAFVGMGVKFAGKLTLNMANHFFKELNQSLVNSGQAIEMGDPESLRQVVKNTAIDSLSGPAKAAVLWLDGRKPEALITMREYGNEKAIDYLAGKVFAGKGSSSLLERPTSVPISKVPHPDSHRSKWLTTM